MIEELSVENLGVVAALRLCLNKGMTAITGETGAGKTLIVGALGLVCGSRADSTLVRPGAEEATVQARFGGPISNLVGDLDLGAETEMVISRSISAAGRSRASISGRMVTASMLAQAGGALVEIHGQHGSQALLNPTAQRDALDAFAHLDLGPMMEARRAMAAAAAVIAELGGDRRSLEREAALIAHQLQELDSAGLEDPGETEALEAERDWLGALSEHREAIAASLSRLSGDPGFSEGAADVLGSVANDLSHHPGLAAIAERATALAAEATELGSELRAELERSEDDPGRLEEVNQRLRLLADLRRKYGETLAEVIQFRESLRSRADELSGLEAKVAGAEAEAEAAKRDYEAQQRLVGEARRAAAGPLATKVQQRLATLGMAKARFEISLGDSPTAEPVGFMLGANPGEPVLSLSKVASGGELSRTMLALRLVLTGGPPTAVFDEVDAGIGGAAALAVGRALADCSEQSQVLVVTHLAQVAAFAHNHIAIQKAEEDGRTVSVARVLDPKERLVELARMLSGHPDSEAARAHAKELLAATGRWQGSGETQGASLGL